MQTDIAGHICTVTDKLKIPFIFKASYRKANRSKLDSFSGLGDKKALEMLARTGEIFRVPVVTDIHSTAEASMAVDYADVLQIPAFLCRQTNILTAAVTNRVVNIQNTAN